MVTFDILGRICVALNILRSKLWESVLLWDSQTKGVLVSKTITCIRKWQLRSGGTVRQKNNLALVRDPLGALINSVLNSLKALSGLPNEKCHRKRGDKEIKLEGEKSKD